MPSSTLFASQSELDKVRLSSSVTVRRYREMESKQDRIGLADFIQERLLERYITPLEAVPIKKKNGFLMMASACLLIETLESFYRGWPSSHESLKPSQIDNPCKPADPKKTNSSKSEVAFCYFFHREPAFAPFRSVASDFYKCVRCGILHQGETSGGWQIRRDGMLFDGRGPNQRVNATKFLAELHLALASYGKKLWEADWNEEIWSLFRTKMDSIIVHSKSKP